MKLILKGPVCIPDVADVVGDVLSEQQIREAFLFFQRYGGLIDVQHTFQPVANLLESYIIESATEFNNMNYPKGTWFISAEVADEEIEQAINDGEYTGFSIFAAPYRSVDEMRRPMKPLPQGMTFNSVDSWKPVAISIVDFPSYNMAKFEVYESDTQFIQKWNNQIGETMTSENQNDEIKMSASIFERLFGGIAKAEPLPADNPQNEPQKNESSDILKRVDVLEEKMDKILEALGKKENPENKPENVPAPDGIKKFIEIDGVVYESTEENSTDGSVDPKPLDVPEGVKKFIEIDGVKYYQENNEDNNLVDNPAGISKSLDIDLQKGTSNDDGSSLMERIGRTANGCKK